MYRPARLLLQWHLSEVCNLRCSHCYQDSYRAQARGLTDWQGLLADYLTLLTPPCGAIPGHINLTGGEPFALRELPALLDLCWAERARFSVGILSNGTLIDTDWARRLKHWQVRYVQVSLDGAAPTHDRIRGAGSHARAVAGIEALVAHGVPTTISFTAQRENFREFAAVAALGVRLGVNRVWSDRVIPCGQGAPEQALSAAETQAYVALLADTQVRLQTPRTEIAMHRALQFLEGGSAVYRCTAADSLVTVMPDGTVYPCRRLPIAAGNAYHQGLAQIYHGDQFARIRTPQTLPGCAHCAFAQQCQGGLRCLSWAMTGLLDQADPGCWLAEQPTPRHIPIYPAARP